MIKSGECMLVNFKEMLKEAKENQYAVPHFNINNLEWTKYILEECQKQEIPVILGVSEGAAKYMGGFKTIAGMVKGLIQDLKISIPVCLHVDHGQTFETCKEAIEAGFTSVMIDASRLPLEENIKVTKEVVDYAHPYGVSVEAEVGHIGGTEDNITSSVTNATLEECMAMVEYTGIDALAPALGSVHGFYHGEPNLDFITMKKISETIDTPLVLHGGSGIPDDKIQEAIRSGISKINVNTELQVAWSDGVKKAINEKPDLYDPRKIIGAGEEKLKKAISQKIELFGTKK